MATISRDTPCLSITNVARDRLPVFRTVTGWSFEVFLVTSENVFMQRVNTIHQNPVRAGLVAQAEDYRWSAHDAGAAGPWTRSRYSWI